MERGAGGQPPEALHPQTQWDDGLEKHFPRLCPQPASQNLRPGAATGGSPCSPSPHTHTQADLAGSLVGRMAAPKDVHVLMLGPCGYVTSCGKVDCAAVILRWEVILDYGVAQGHRSVPYKREAEHQGRRRVGQRKQRTEGYTLKMEEGP